MQASSASHLISRSCKNLFMGTLADHGTHHVHGPLTQTVHIALPAGAIFSQLTVFPFLGLH